MDEKYAGSQKLFLELGPCYSFNSTGVVVIIKTSRATLGLLPGYPGTLKAVIFFCHRIEFA